ncbi:hypothetical protein OGAPHI_003008 [Ogataea philodendri]|uniref:Uncharacterized protein n=1 Tax=Ogataea philodendri TaxID=1378263 RepID=A0A9P8P9F6_9ASCO|nr:uncharacterized protein OGAPHI_003008 [Ogataea philodendri]KAH3667359.1 hypothetical protein OGAPHI_003008 [Ogataea philodendri]
MIPWNLTSSSYCDVERLFFSLILLNDWLRIRLRVFRTSGSSLAEDLGRIGDKGTFWGRSCFNVAAGSSFKVRSKTGSLFSTKVGV